MDELESKVVYFLMGYLLCMVVKYTTRSKSMETIRTLLTRKGLSDKKGGFIAPVRHEKFAVYNPSLDQNKIMRGEVETYFDESETQDRLYDQLEK